VRNKPVISVKSKHFLHLFCLKVIDEDVPVFPGLIFEPKKTLAIKIKRNGVLVEVENTLTMLSKVGILEVRN